MSYKDTIPLSVWLWKYYEKYGWTKTKKEIDNILEDTAFDFEAYIKELKKQC